MSDDKYNRDWSRDRQKTAALIWVSFLIAAVMSVVFFAAVDPLLILENVDALADASRETGYAVCFFFFWSGTALSSWLSLRITRRKRQQPRPVGRQR